MEFLVLDEIKNGNTTKKLDIVGTSNSETGTEVTFQPSTDIFTNINFIFKTLESRLRELAFLNAGLKIKLIDNRNNQIILLLYGLFL